MPGYKTHVISALVCYYLILFVIVLCGQPEINLCLSLVWLMSIVAGSLFPDIDIKSKGQKLFYCLFFLIVFLALICKNTFIAISVSLFSFLPIISKHRGIFHNVGFLLVLIISFAKIFIYNMPQHEYLILSSTAFFTVGVKLHILFDLYAKKIFKIKKIFKTKNIPKKRK